MAAVILDVVCDLGSDVLKTRSSLLIGLMVAAFVASSLLQVNVILIILAATAFGVLRAAYRHGKAVHA